MIYPGLKLGCDLLSEDGVIFIGIDDNEAANLRLICDEIFGEGFENPDDDTRGPWKADPFQVGGWRPKSAI